ncbi:hypothetical protein GBA65_05125 [Rubrobacter marinus]|uniref:Uncharacterized protein n=1 Tax=Rubrobacter marinus TaxID=2653852 RepID=A0A6G8PUW2_9ACTN|nr:hypothetical protein [Rubrobacter marinus]QIN78001.1 hypothetical protein GBA65_05125 [Rubrobacter marinus]
MPDPTRELPFEELPPPPLYKLVDEEGRDVFAEAEVGGEPATVGVLLESEELARELSEDAAEHGLEALSGLEPRVLPGWAAVEVFASAGEGYVLVVSEAGTGLFYAGTSRAARPNPPGDDVSRLPHLRREGEAPLLTVETDGGEVLVTALFTSTEKATAFRDAAPHLDLPEGLGVIDDAGGLVRHARIAREAGAEYAVFDPETGLAEAIPIEELMREPHQR